jgi:multidrug efflux pump
MGGFFVDRPVFATVIALLLALVGALAATQLAVEQYPNVAPPQVKVTAVYPGASPEILENVVAAPLEREMNGVSGLLYMQSTSSSSGLMELSVVFEPGTDLDIAAVEVNNRVKRVEALMPQTVLQNGIKVDKTNPAILLILTLQSKTGQFDRDYISNLANSSILPEIKRIAGVGDVTLFGYPYAMRIWLNPELLAKYKLTVSDVFTAIREQNQNYAVGEIGTAPNEVGQVLTFPVQTAGAFTEPDQFANIIVRAAPDGSVVRVRDVARVELGADDYQISLRLNGKPASGLGVYLRPGANALVTAQQVRDKMQALSSSIPSDVEWRVPYDTTVFVNASIELVMHTFIEAFILVLVVVYLFLGSLRATLIPMLAIPVSLIGTMAGLLLMGFSINMLTLFGLVLAIGIVVDDAIVVVEAVEKIMHEKGLAPREAAREAMQEIGSAIVGITAVICAVFVPIAFLGGVTGVLYKQFAITITISTLLSALMALTLTPALCALILKPGHAKPRPIQAFDRFVERVTGRYVGAVGGIIRRWVRFLLIYGVILLGVVFLFRAIPGGFVPEEDKGTMFVVVDLPSAASVERTRAVVERVEGILKQQPEVADTIAVLGFSIFYRYSNQAFIYVTLKPWSERTTAEQHVTSLIRRVNGIFYGINEATVFALNEPPISGMGNISGFDYRLLALDGNREQLNQTAAELVAAARQDATLAGVRSVAAPTVRTLFIDVDRNRVKSLGISLPEVYQTIGSLLGSSFVNQFTAFGTNLNVKLQSERQFRSDPQSLQTFYVRNQKGEMVPLSVVARSEFRLAPIALNRYNGYPAVQINGTAAQGFSSGQAMAAMERLSAEKLPAGMSFQWSGQSLQEKIAGQQAGFIFFLSFVFVFLFLAALYESFTLPVSVFLIVPIGIFGALVALLLRGTPNDVFFQISLITLVGLAGKNGILIVEFAKLRYEQGLSILDAALDAARLRLRPIVMTSLAFILGVLPRVRASGAGAATQHSVGTGILGGMLAATLIGVFFTPLFYWVVMTYLGGKKKRADGIEAALHPAPAHDAGAATPPQERT